MSLEQKDNEEYFSQKKKDREQERSQTFFNEKKILLESSKLLKKLAGQIAEEFGLDSVQVESLIKSETHQDLSKLEAHFTKERKLALAEKILGAQQHVESYSKENREDLRKSLSEDIFDPQNANYQTGKKLFGESIYTRAKNPQKISDHIVGLGLGLFDSSEAITLFIYSLGKGILLTPYHIYLMIRGDGSTESFKHII